MMPIKEKIKFLLTLLALLTMVEDTTAVQVPVIVKTSSGPVAGHIASKTFGVSEYLGIPYVCFIDL
jgi:hypothetical protein